MKPSGLRLRETLRELGPNFGRDFWLEIFGAGFLNRLEFYAPNPGAMSYRRSRSPASSMTSPGLNPPSQRQEVLDQQRDVLASLTQRRHRDHHLAQGSWRSARNTPSRRP